MIAATRMANTRDMTGEITAMGPSQKLLWKLYAGLLGAVTTFASQKLVTLAWRAITGDEPPSPTDPRTPLRVAVSWAIASAVGVGVTQIVTQRFAAKSWSDEMGTDVPEGDGKIKLSI
jgi:hypothetical protein